MNNIKKTFLVVCFLASCSCLFGQNDKDVKFKYTDADQLTILGKIDKTTENPFHRVNLNKYEITNETEINEVKSPAGLIVLFKTDSRIISVKAGASCVYNSSFTMPLAYRGFTLFVKEGKKWVWAGCNVMIPGEKHVGDNRTLVRNMDTVMREYMLYLPTFTELTWLKIGIEDGYTIKPAQNPYKHKIAFYGSSFTQGTGASSSAMTYPMQFGRHCGYEILGFGMAGHCMMQDYAAEVLMNCDADAIVLDVFSNPSAEMIEQRLPGFVEKLVTAHPGKPIIFQQTIRREFNNTNKMVMMTEKQKQDMSEKMMAEICAKYKDVYFIHPNATSPNYDASVDGVHPDDYGYALWAQSIEKAIPPILKKYFKK